jgi:hypothetical protein
MCVLPRDKKVTVGQHGLAREVILIAGRKVGECRVADRALRAERLREHETRKAQEVKAYSRV